MKEYTESKETGKQIPVPSGKSRRCLTHLLWWENGIDYILQRVKNEQSKSLNLIQVPFL